MVYIYILELEQGKYYIGKTNNPNIRILDHFENDGSAWTRLYKPIRILSIIENCDDYDEDKYTKIYMDKYGIDNVRGGSFVTIKLDQSTIKHLKLSSMATNDKCFNCGKSGHFVKYCPDKQKFQNCSRCGRNNHTMEKCYAKKHINGNLINNKIRIDEEIINNINMNVENNVENNVGIRCDIVEKNTNNTDGNIFTPKIDNKNMQDSCVIL